MDANSVCPFFRTKMYPSLEKTADFMTFRVKPIPVARLEEIVSQVCTVHTSLYSFAVRILPRGLEQVCIYISDVSQACTTVLGTDSHYDHSQVARWNGAIIVRPTCQNTPLHSIIILTHTSRTPPDKASSTPRHHPTNSSCK